jgi:hypothetical protein
MGAFWLTVYILVVCIGGLFFGADSRPNFSGGRTNYKEHWFIHDRRS